MVKASGWRWVWGVIVVCGVMAMVSSAQVTFTTLVNFNGTNGDQPFAGLTQGADGNFYGTTAGNFSEGFGYGTVFELTPAGTLTTLHNFCSFKDCRDGFQPEGSLILGTDGNFYGTTSDGGQGGLGYTGTVFRITPTGILTTLYRFCTITNCADGDQPFAGLVEGTNGNLYGTTSVGGAFGGGTVFKIAPTGKLITLHSFCPPPTCDDGGLPAASLVQASNGNFYGETLGGGVNGGGTIFEITPAGELTTLFSFVFPYNGTDGNSPSGGLIQATNGYLYGDTRYGGTHCASDGGCGTIFKISLTGKLTTLHNFNGTEGAEPFGSLVQGTDGNFYGTTSNGGAEGHGSVFEITPEGRLTNLYAFCSQPKCADGAVPFAGLLPTTDGNFYGTTSGFGANGGTIFRLSTGLAPFVAFVRNRGRVGQQFGILGYGLTGTSSVSLNGIAASFKLQSDTLLIATVPSGATTGYVTVTTPSGTLTSNVPFHVIP